MIDRFETWLPWKGAWLSMAATPEEVRSPEVLARAARQPSVASVWNTLPQGTKPSDIGSVVLVGDEYPSDLPEILRSLPELTTLSTPAHLVEKIDSALAARLVQIVVESGKARLPPHPFPRLRVLRSNDGELEFEASQVPALERLSLNKPSARMQKTIAQLTALWGLRVRPISQSTLAWITSLKQLKCVTLNGSRLSELTPLSDCKHLEQLGLTAFTSVKDIKPIAGLEMLDEVAFNQCTGLTRIEALLELPRLKKVVFYASGAGKSHEKVLRTLEARGVEMWPSLD